ncbi:MAG: hypothetical protein DHS20C10_07540 [marine bacterium B5-7]|nr:MAG: hypothetical protein DHS20C10_07540 [marine bacterium B5-7]
MSVLTPLPYTQWKPTLGPADASAALTALETGHVLFFPGLAFQLQPEEQAFLTPGVTDGQSKNVSWQAATKTLKGCSVPIGQHELLSRMMQRFYDYSLGLVQRVLPDYQGHLMPAKTSYRPVQIKGRASSYRQDDTRLHVDAFPSNPVQGKRILRVFSNINPNGEDRVWRAGEPFPQLAQRFAKQIPKPLPGSRALLNMLGITKSPRSLYDHFMLQLHHRMKADMQYQQTVDQETLRLPPNTTWMVFTDQVSHAAMSGQYVLEQSLYLPVEAMQDPARSPYRVIEAMSALNGM